MLSCIICTQKACLRALQKTMPERPYRLSTNFLDLSDSSRFRKSTSRVLLWSNVNDSVCYRFPGCQNFQTYFLLKFELFRAYSPTQPSAVCETILFSMFKVNHIQAEIQPLIFVYFLSKLLSPSLHLHPPLCEKFVLPLAIKSNKVKLWQMRGSTMANWVH